MAIVKPEMKSYIWVETGDGSIQQVEEEVAMFCPMICREVIQKSKGSSKNHAISLPQRVNPASLGSILEYCKFHQLPGRSNKERKFFNEKFIKLDTKKLCELTSAADSLQLKPLVDLTSRALARMIEGKSPEEIRETFNLPDDLTEEEKLEPLRNFTDDPRVRLLNRLYARKRKELKERQKKKNGEVEEESHVDERSVEDLLSFINSGDSDSKAVKPVKNKKKNKRKKEQLTNCSTKENGCNNNVTSHSESLKSLTFSHELDFDDFDDDDDSDELDPVLREEIDREVEEFARRLNSVWPERINGNGSLKRYTGLVER